MDAVLYAIERFWLHLLVSIGLITIYVFVLAWLGRKWRDRCFKKGKVNSSPLTFLQNIKVVVSISCVLNLITGLLNEAWDYPHDGPYKTITDVLSWFIGSGIWPYAMYRLHKMWEEQSKEVAKLTGFPIQE